MDPTVIELGPAPNLDAVARALNAASHALGGPLQSAMNALFVAKRERGPDPSGPLDEMERQFELIRSRLGTLLAISDVLQPARRAPARLEALSAALDAAVADERQRLSIEIRAEERAWLLDGEMCARAIIELVHNAFEASDPQAPVLVRMIDSGDHLEIETINERGRAWPDPPERAADPLFTTKPKTLGLGLPIACAVARAHDGWLRVVSDATRTTVTLSLRGAAT